MADAIAPWMSWTILRDVLTYSSLPDGDHPPSRSRYSFGKRIAAAQDAKPFHSECSVQKPTRWSPMSCWSVAAQWPSTPSASGVQTGRRSERITARDMQAMSE
eukprot:2105603-Heterocapsa_arctica.AAC.1